MPAFTVSRLLVLIALVIDPAKVLLAVATLYALSGPALWLHRHRATPPAPLD